MNIPTHRSTRQRLATAAFSLVETMMATGIVSTAALGTLTLLAGSLTSSQDGQLRSKALVIAQEVFHDLQIGSVKMAPAVDDKRQTKELAPLVPTDLSIARHVILFDASGIPLPTNDQPTPGQHGMVYNDGSVNAKASWIALIEGTEANLFTVDPNSETANSVGIPVGAGQVITVPDAENFGPLGTESYDYPTVGSPPSPTAPPPKSGLTQVTISIESPPGAPAISRKKFRYQFLWNR